MEVLKELINVITKYKIASIDVIGSRDTPRKDLPLNDFYESILNEEFSSDEDAAQHFFKTTAKDPKYKKLKKVLKKQLINTTYFIDTSQPSFNDLERAYYNCCKDWASINILLGRAARRAAIELSEKVLKQAIKYEFTVLIVDITKTLKSHYGGFLRDKNKYNRYKKLFNLYQEIWHAEMDAEELYMELITHYISLKHVHKTADAYLIQLAPYVQKFQSYKLHLHFYLIELIKNNSLNDYNAMASTCEKAISFFESKDCLFKNSLSLFYYQKTICHIQLKEYDKGKKASDKNLALTDKGTISWFSQLELSLLLSFHTSKHKKAYDIFIEIQSHKFNPINSKIYEAYLYYLVNINKITFIDEAKNKLSKFRVGKFLNNIPDYDVEEFDVNIPTLVIQTLFMLHKKKYKEALKRIKKLEEYASTNLYKGKNYRSNCFIKMLSEIIHNRFHRAAVIRKSQKHFQKLNKTTLNTINQQSNIEIIPYEKLWEFILESLDNSFH